MTGPEQGFLLLTSSLADPGRKPLTVAQFRELARRVARAERDTAIRELAEEDLLKLGYPTPMARRILGLLAQTNLLREYLRRGETMDCWPITRLSPLYPQTLRHRLGLDSPGVLWAKGDGGILEGPAVAVVGSRDLREENRKFAEEAGRQAALQGFTLVSGNARGVDRTAQEACLEAGGKVISVVADSLQKQPLRRNLLFLSLDDFDRDFSAQRALQRNRVIHCLGAVAIAAQCSLGKGGTWHGIQDNLKGRWNPVCCFDDGSEAAAELQNRGVGGIGLADLADFTLLSGNPNPFF